MEVWIRCSHLIILSLSPCLSYRAKPDSKDVLPKGIPFPETELPESKLRKVASPKLPKTVPYLWRQVFYSPYMEIMPAALWHICTFTAIRFVSNIVTRLETVSEYPRYLFILKVPQDYNGILNTMLQLYSIHFTEPLNSYFITEDMTLAPSTVVD